MRIENMEKLKAVFKKFPQAATAEFDRALDRSAKKIEALAVKKAPVNKGSGGGNLRQSIKSSKIGPAAHAVEAGASYAGYVNFGTKPHIIRARGKVLATSARNSPGWPNVSKKGYAIFGKTVNHPGTKAQPFFTDAIKEGEPFMNNEFEQAMKNVISKVTK